MNEYFVAGGINIDLQGEERFDLVSTGPGEAPYVLINSVIGYFRLLWQNSHLYRVEHDYSLSLVATSSKAQQCGVEAPVKVWPDANLLEKLQAVIKHTSVTPDKKGEDGGLGLTIA